MPAATIQMLIELDEPIVFHRWFPDGQNDSIRFNDSGIEQTIWFDFDNMSFVAREDIAMTNNIMVNNFHLNARVEISDSLKSHILTNTARREVATGHDSIEYEYKTLGEAIHKSTSYTINRLLEYLYAEKGQYWLEKMRYDVGNSYQFFTKNNAKIYFDDEQLYRFYPDNTIRLDGVISRGDKRFVIKDDWSDIQAFVCGKSRTPVAKYILAIAHELANKGHKRASLIEAICALELKLHEFARIHESGRFSEKLKSRIESKSLHELVKKLGLRGSFGTLLPIILSDEELPTVIIEQCRDAIDLRNSVVHSGSRNIADKKLKEVLRAVQECCARFDSIMV